MSFRYHVITSSTSFSRPFGLSQETGSEPNLSLWDAEGVILDILQPSVPFRYHVMTSSTSFRRPFRLRREAGSDPDLSLGDADGVILDILQPCHHIINISITLFPLLSWLGYLDVAISLHHLVCLCVSTDVYFAILNNPSGPGNVGIHQNHPCHFTTMSRRRQHHSVERLDLVEKVKASPIYRLGMQTVSSLTFCNHVITSSTSVLLSTPCSHGLAILM